MHWLKTCECFALPHWPLLLQTVLKRLSCLFLMLFALWWTDHVLLFSYSFLSRGIRTELCRPFPPHGLLLHQQVKSPYHHYCKLLDIHISAVSFKAHIYCFCFCYLKTIITKLKKEELLTQLQSRVNQNTQSLQFVLWLPRGLLVAGYVWNTSSRWHLCQTPKPPLLIWRSSSCSLSPPWNTELLTLHLTRKLKSSTACIHNLLAVHNMGKMLMHCWLFRYVLTYLLPALHGGRTTNVLLKHSSQDILDIEVRKHSWCLELLHYYWIICIMFVSQTKSCSFSPMNKFT